MRSSFSLSASQNEKRSTSKIMGLLRKQCGIPLHFIVDFHGLSTSKMLVSRGWVSHQVLLHRCTWATDCSNASFSRFRLLTLANPHEFVSIGFHWGYLGCHHHPPGVSQANRAKITGLLSNTIMVVHRCWCIFVLFFAKKNKESFSRRSSPLYFPSMIQKMMQKLPPKKKGQ